jgi:hypothetical protein
LFSRLKLKSSTPIGEKLEELLLAYVDDIVAAQARGGRKALSAIKPVNYIIITDGHPSQFLSSHLQTHIVYPLSSPQLMTQNQLSSRQPRD